MFQLSKGGVTGSDPMGVKEISKELERRKKYKRSGRWFNSTEVHYLLRCTTYIGQCVYNKRDSRTRKPKSPDQWAIDSVPKIIDEDLFADVQRLMHARDPQRASNRSRRIRLFCQTLLGAAPAAAGWP
jgi:uncharacterized circularly permuted ATP-grasp superfamily protein